MSKRLAPPGTVALLRTAFFPTDPWWCRETGRPHLAARPSDRGLALILMEPLDESLAPLAALSDPPGEHGWRICP